MTVSFGEDCFQSLAKSVDGDVAANEEEVDSESTATTMEEPDTSVLKLYDLLLVTLHSNPLYLARFSQQETFHITLLQLLKEIKAPLTAFTSILKWAAKASYQVWTSFSFLQSTNLGKGDPEPSCEV